MREEQSHPAFEWDAERLWPQFLRLADAAPDALALADCGDRLWSRGALRGQAIEIAALLKAAGVGPGDRVLVTAHKNAATIATALAISSLQATFCPVSPKLGAGDLALLESLLGHAAKVSGTGSTLPDVTAAAGERSTDPRDRNAVLIGFTSGSTGVPKG